MFQKKDRKSSKLTKETIATVQVRHAHGYPINEIAKAIDVKYDTLSKAILQGRITLPALIPLEDYPVMGKTHRSVIDDASGMGKACTNTLGRVLAAKSGEAGTISFNEHIDVSYAGILFSLPSLLSNGLLTHREDFKPDDGFYSVESVFLSLAFLALLRAKTLAQSTSIPCGELGRAMGLDRIPEVKTLRKRIKRFCNGTDIEKWSLLLSKEWMTQHPDLAGVLYIDGHVNIYYGHSTKMPKRYVSRLRLCMSGSTDYWVNDSTGQPFFVVNEVVSGGMIEKL